MATALLIFLLGILLLPQAAPAHPPSDMQLAFDRGTRVLSVTITHAVADPTTHYVKHVLATEGGEVIIDGAYTSQPASPTFTYTYPLAPSVKGEIRVTAECSIFGSITRSIETGGDIPPSLTLPAPPEDPVRRSPPETAMGGGTPAVPPATPTRAAAGVFPLAVAVAFLVWRFRR